MILLKTELISTKKQIAFMTSDKQDLINNNEKLQDELTNINKQLSDCKIVII